VPRVALQEPQGRQGRAGSGGFLSTAVSWISSLFHGGGLASNPVGKRSVSASIFAGGSAPPRCGIPGLRPKEVPAILENDEEVLKTI